MLSRFIMFLFEGLAKILKKYDKRTGGLLRLPYIQKVLKQPFFTTELVSKLIKECENVIDLMFPVAEMEVHAKEESKEVVKVNGEGIFKNTVSALLTMHEIRSGSSTYGQFSLPPLNLPDSEIGHLVQLNSPIPIVWNCQLHSRKESILAWFTGLCFVSVPVAYMESLCMVKSFTFTVIQTNCVSFFEVSSAAAYSTNYYSIIDTHWLMWNQELKTIAAELDNLISIFSESNAYLTMITRTVQLTRITTITVIF